MKSLSIKLDKEIIYKENLPFCKVSTNQPLMKKFQSNIIIEFARIYGFQVDFQRDIRKQDKFQIMYEIFFNEKKRNGRNWRNTFC